MVDKIYLNNTNSEYYTRTEACFCTKEDASKIALVEMHDYEFGTSSVYNVSEDVSEYYIYERYECEKEQMFYAEVFHVKDGLRKTLVSTHLKDVSYNLSINSFKNIWSFIWNIYSERYHCIL